MTKTFALNQSIPISLHPGQRGAPLRVRQGGLPVIVSFMQMIFVSHDIFYEQYLIFSIYYFLMLGLSATAAPTFTPIPGGSPVSRIKLYWQTGYMWQDRHWEERFCLQCRNWRDALVETCKVGDKIEIEKCGRSIRQKFVRVEGDKTIRPAMSPGLCISHQNHADDIYLDTLSINYCDGSKQQRFYIVGTPWQKKGKFEIRTSLTSNKQPTCLTNPHHPRRKENIIPQRCDRARIHETSSWTLY